MQNHTLHLSTPALTTCAPHSIVFGGTLSSHTKQLPVSCSAVGFLSQHHLMCTCSHAHIPSQAAPSNCKISSPLPTSCAMPPKHSSSLPNSKHNWGLMDGWTPVVGGCWILPSLPSSSLILKLYVAGGGGVLCLCDWVHASLYMHLSTRTCTHYYC